MAVLVAVWLAAGLAAAEERDGPPRGDVEATVGRFVDRCVEQHDGETVGGVPVRDFCEVQGWARLGRHYPDLLEVARAHERRGRAQYDLIRGLKRSRNAERRRASRWKAVAGVAGGVAAALATVLVVDAAGGVELGKPAAR